MSEVLSYYDFMRSSESWTSAFGSADHGERTEFLDLLKSEFRRVKYLNIKKGVVTAKERPMLVLATEYNITVKYTELVKIDFVNVWSNFVVADQVGAHFIDPKETGFCFNFALRSQKERCIVGQIDAKGVRP